MNNETIAQAIKVMADYECHPLWMTGPDLGEVAPDDERLQLSPELAGRLTAWAEEFDGTLNLDDPISSGFLTREREESFAVTGELIARELARVLGSAWRVSYYDIRSETTYEITDA